MTPRRSQRAPKPITVWEEKEAPSAALDPKITAENARTKPETALKPVPVCQLPESAKLDHGHLPELPDYHPPLNLRYKASKSIATGLSVLQAFQLFFTQQMVDIIVLATNAYAAKRRRNRTERKFTRTWKPVNSTDIWRYLGCLLYMGQSIESQHTKYWSLSHRLGEFLALKRFQQIHRYLTLRDDCSWPKQPDEPFTWKLEPIASLVRQNCRQNWSPSSHLCIDESMVSYRGRTLHKTKMKNKPIPEGYKIWVLGDNGYVSDWLWHSQRDGPERIPKQGIIVDRLTKNGHSSIYLAPTFAVLIRLTERLRELRPMRIFCFYLDNLFLNVNIAQALLAMNICCTGITRKNAQGIPSWLIDLKKNNRDLIWNSMLAEQVDLTLCFLWQDNNAVLGITTAYCLKNEIIWRVRKRPSPTSTNARIVRPVFGNETSKHLPIPKAIDRYNHHMNGVDRHNQLRKNLTVHRKYERRTWRPQWYFVFDTCCVNGYLIWKGEARDRGNRKHRRFHEELSSVLLNWPYSEARTLAPLNATAREHRWDKYSKRGYCIWCKQHPKEWIPKRARGPLTEIVNSESPPKRVRQSQVWGGCHGCGVYLCRRGDCFEAFHRRSNNK
jgi:Transposase IS4